PTVSYSPFEINYVAAHPLVLVEATLTVPAWIPVVGGRRIDLGDDFLSLEHQSIILPFSDGPLSASVTLTLDPDDGSACVTGTASAFTWTTSFGPDWFRYDETRRQPATSWPRLIPDEWMEDVREQPVEGEQVEHVL